MTADAAARIMRAMQDSPKGTVTFLFTDIEGSTRRWDDFPDAMRRALERHDLLLRRAVEESGGRVFKTIGDAFCAAFGTATAGLTAAIAAQRAIAAEDWSAFGEGFPPLALRMGLHTGEAVERDGDYFGPPVNRVARLEAAGHGGQVLLSGAAYNLVREHLPTDFDLVDLGRHRLKDLRYTEHIFQLRGPGMPQVDRPPATAEALHPRDRVRVAEQPSGVSGSRETVPADVKEVLSRMESALRADDDQAVTLTPEEAATLARLEPFDWREWRLGRVAEWSQPRYRLDDRFVGLTLLVDQGEEVLQGRWQPSEKRYDGLAELLDTIREPAIVVLGPPGSGKSTLLRRLELDMAIAGLRGEDSADQSVSLYVTLSTYRAAEPGTSAPSPAAWLGAQWTARYPDLPPLDELLAEGRVTLLLDALNEMPTSGELDFREQVQRWKQWLQQTILWPGNRVLFSCRSLDYSQSLSTPDLRVPQVRIEPLTDGHVRDFLSVYSPGRWREIWQALDGSPQLEVLRSPYFLALLVDQVEASGEMPAGRAALFTGFVRQALRRELERDNPLFASEALLASRDRRQVTRWRWRGTCDLPERGILVPCLARLAHAMQRDRADGERSQVRVDVDEALDMLDTDLDEEIVAAGEALSVLDEDEAVGELMFIHQLVQEYFAAREMAASLDPALVRAPWRAEEIHPPVDAVVDGLDPADPLPPLPQTGWEETTILAAAMTSEPERFLRVVAEENLVLAGRCAVQPELLPHLPGELLDALREGLVGRLEDPSADLRHRIACGELLGAFGDPRFKRNDGPEGGYLLPPFVEIPGGSYPIGENEPIAWSYAGAVGSSDAHVPRHVCKVESFLIGRYPVTNAEWDGFIASGGYEDERWWDTADGRAWRRGELANEGILANSRNWREVFLARPDAFEQMAAKGQLGAGDREAEERWRSWLELDDAAFEEALVAHWPPRRETEPSAWHDERFKTPTQPVVGVSWYEARAYCAWLSAQTGLALRLPTEVEWEAAARGLEARSFAYGNAADRRAANTVETHLKRPSPVGAFPSGRTPEGVYDMSGNVFEWTSSLFGSSAPRMSDTTYPYPYDPADGREEAEAPPSLHRIVRGGVWIDSQPLSRAAMRNHVLPDYRNNNIGFRLAGAMPGVRGS